MNATPQKFLECIAEAENGVLTEKPNEVVTGFAGTKLTGLIQRLVAAIGGDYLEVGVFQGSSLLNTAYSNPDIKCYGIDNFDFFDPKSENKNMVIDRAKQLDISNYEIIDKDFEIGLKEFDGKIGTYFIDGPHDYRSQLMCLAYGVSILEDGGCMVVDDANYPHVRQATADFLHMYPEYKLVFEAYTNCHPHNMTPDQISSARDGWWDGVHLIVHDPEDLFEGITPAIPHNSRFVRDHHVQIVSHAPVATEAAMLMASLSKPWRLPKSIVRYMRARRALTSEIKGKFLTCNTDSSSLSQNTATIK
ncbi:class I SAM-dependent methyltransferase [Parasphingorhabdus sp.]|jgi:hypothetical protein|uniref:class I SAM-dependent methyltransferase n=1 Tax=Parasphingorhabdus sp. TaxID=2709688 RepID=UPI003D2DEE2F